MIDINLYAEEELSESIKKNCRYGVDYLSEKYGPSLRAEISNIVYDRKAVESILQDTFVTIWLYSHHYECSRNNFYTWILTIARNKATEFSRNSAALKVGSARKLAIVLPDAYQNLLQLAFYSGYSYNEIAKITNLSANAIKTHISNAMMLLRKNFNYSAILAS